MLACLRFEGADGLQQTLKDSFSVKGVCLHSGKSVVLAVKPALADVGIVFKRLDLPSEVSMIKAHYSNVVESSLCTTIQNEHGTRVSTVEHLLAALAGTGIHNAIVEVDGPEIPILDGSSLEFVKKILSVGVTKLTRPIRAFRVIDEIEITDGDLWAKIVPSKTLSISFGIDFKDSAIGNQRLSLSMCNGSFVREISYCRTFCSMSDVEEMHSRGLAKGGSLENAVVAQGDQILTPGGLRIEDECVRHKILDALGDLSLAGGVLIGSYVSYKGGHRLTNALLRKAFSRSGYIESIDVNQEMIKKQPGFHVMPEDLVYIN